MCLLLLTLCLIGCEKESIHETNIDLAEHTISNSFQYQKWDSIIPYDFEVAWDKPQEGYSEELQSHFYEFPLIWKNNFNPESLNEKRTSNLFYKIIAIKNNDSYSFYPIKFTVSKEVSKENISLLSLEKYKGTYYIYNENKEIIYGEIVEYGEIKGSILDNKPSVKGINACTMCVDILVDHSIDWYFDRGNGNLEYWKTETSRSTKTVCDYSGGGVIYENSTGIHGGGNTSGGNKPIIEEFDDKIVEDDKIINNLTGKADCVYGKLEKNTLLSKTLKRFKGENASVHLIINQESNLRIKDKNGNSVLVNGVTNYGSSHYIAITLNTEQANNRPSLAVARTLLHESIHAEIYRMIKTTSGISYTNGEWRLPNNSRVNFPSLFDAYENDTSLANHNYIAKYYIDALKIGMKEYATSIGETYSDKFYEDMAWAGLLDTQAWNDKYADKAYADKEKKRIRSVINNFENSGTNACNN